LLCIYKMKPLSNININKYFKRNLFYGGTIAKDMLHKEPLKYGDDLTHVRKFWIVNLDDSTGPGTHWVLVSLLNPDVAIYYDAFAVDPPREVLAFMKKWRPESAMNENIIQDVNSTNCGYFCLLVGEELCKGRLFMDVMEDFSPEPKKNEAMITARYKNNKILN